MPENLLALAVRPLDVATPLLQARQIQKMQADTAQSEFTNRQAEMGAEFRGLAPFVNHPEFGQRWTEAMDRMAQRGILDPQRHAQLRSSPSPLLLQQGLAMTSSGDQFLKMQQLQRTQAADAAAYGDLNSGQSIPGQPSPSALPGQPSRPSPTVPTASMLDKPVASTDPTMSPGVEQVRRVNEQPLSFNDRFAGLNQPTPATSQVQTVSQPAQGQSSPQPDEKEINRLRRIASNPYVSEPIRETAKMELRALIDKNAKGDTPEAQAASRRRAVVAQGGDPNDPQMKAFILSGRMPREDQQPLSAADKKAILEADENISSASAAIQALNRAKTLSKTAMGFRGAGMIAEVGALGGSQTALDTIELDNVVTTAALAQLKTIFGGNPTEGERKILLEIQGSSRLPDKARQKIFDRAIEAANRRLGLYQQRSNELRGQTFYKPGGGRSQAQQPAAPSIPPPPPGFEIQ